ncbi:MAG: transcription antitermination factor NusB [Truepera sp.]|nr:transcription antitermination factor NusB [Truepera sp.]
MARRKARELAFLTLFVAEQGKTTLAEAWEHLHDEPEDSAEAYSERLDPESLIFSRQLVDAFAAHRQEIDQQLAAVIEGWSFSQMAQTDLNILRLALTELRYLETPAQLVIEMAVRLAKKFGGEESGRFVHGVLARLVKALELPAAG